VLANDHNAYAATLARCYIQADREDVLLEAEQLIRELNRLPGRSGYFTETFCIQSRFFQPKNGQRVDAIREAIARYCLDSELESVLLVSLMEAADRVDSTTGLQMAYLKDWAPRSFNDLELRMPDVLQRAAAGKGSAHQLDALDALEVLSGDVAYIDPPYNQHKYLGNYHIWETLVLWDMPEVYGVACKRLDCRSRSSVFNSRPESGPALRRVLRDVRARSLVVSFNNEGYFNRKQIEDMLRARGEVFVIEQDFKRYVGAQIGIYNPSGEKVGQVSHLRNKELLYIVSEDHYLIDKLQKSILNQMVLPIEDSSEIPEEGVVSETGSIDLSKRSRLKHNTNIHLKNVENESRRKTELESSEERNIRSALFSLLQERTHITSRDAQAVLGLDAMTLRPHFQSLLARGEATSTGKRRGTIYHATTVSDSIQGVGDLRDRSPQNEDEPSSSELESVDGMIERVDEERSEQEGTPSHSSAECGEACQPALFTFPGEIGVDAPSNSA
jgi:adenine-specific DNA-methyltransferase